MFSAVNGASAAPPPQSLRVFLPLGPFTLAGGEGRLLGFGKVREEVGRGAGQPTSSVSVTIAMSPWNELTMYLMDSSLGKSAR